MWAIEAMKLAISLTPGKGLNGDGTVYGTGRIWVSDHGFHFCASALVVAGVVGIDNGATSGTRPAERR
jgi:hypothetical protein